VLGTNVQGVAFRAGQYAGPFLWLIEIGQSARRPSPFWWFCHERGTPADLIDSLADGVVRARLLGTLACARVTFGSAFVAGPFFSLVLDCPRVLVALRA
jgi:hypothetical protein